ncbi:hypothetical protein BO221_44155 [Archangium sp. Cb G35]|uniref:hypothetical protein n=1 Tax=Archangium sp. Cb G35 TaxID=1920190 RepID=UPI0009369540|nr:hypothetical protein [Archangium sp. Cb G35]OJT17568.1 hypothetical protein BO221_44155 [Archangium sp. Cb G35]
MEVRARILVLTEDSGKQAQPTIQKLLKEALKLLVESVDLNPERIRLEPLPENERALLAVRANQWKEQQPPTIETIRLLELIATRLVEPAGFVVFHFDTDRVWAERHNSENRQKFETIIRERVRRILRGEVPAPRFGSQRPRPTLTAEQIELALKRLLILSPCYSIESWLYQSTKEILAHCQERHDSEAHVLRIQSWAADRTLLDDVSRPKHEALTCVGDLHNEALAKAFPAEEVWLAERSFFESVERLRACSTLVEAIGYGGHHVQ